MPEDLSTHPYPVVDQPEAQAVSYQQLLDDPATHPGLRPHLERLAASDVGLAVLHPPQFEDVGDGQVPVEPHTAQPYADRHQLHVVRSPEELTEMPSLGDMAADLQRRSTTMFDGPPSNYGASYFRPDKKAYERLESGQYSEQELVDYIREARILCDAFEDIEARREGFSDGSRYEDVLAALTTVPPDKLRAVYQSPELSANLRFMMENVQGAENVRDALMLVQRVHDRKDILDLWEQDSPAFDDPTFQELLTKKESAEAIASTLEVRTALWPEGMDPVDEAIAKREWGDRFLERVAGLPERARAELQFDSYSRTNNPHTGLLDATRLKNMLFRTADNVRALGMKRIAQLHNKAGITSFDYHSAESLRLMCDVLDGNPAAIEHLQKGDVSVVFINTKGDYNGVMGNVKDNYATQSNRTLYFEIGRPENFYRHMVMLNKRGIKPSTIVMAAHGEVGELPIHDGKNGVSLITNKGRRLINKLPRWRKSARINHGEYQVSEAEGLGRIIRDYMQDSKGVDDNREARGRRRIIMDACLAARPVDVYRPGWRNRLLRFNGTPLEESLAETVLKTAKQPNLDVFGNHESFNPQPTEDGIGVQHFLSYEDEFGNLVNDDELPATRYALDRRGRVVASRMESIPLRRFSNKQVERKLRAA